MSNTVLAKPKKLHLEAIRIVAICFVIFNHTGFLQFNNTGTVGYACVMLSSIICKIAVPLFFMVSGGLLLGKHEPIEVVFKKRILRFLIVIVVFSFLNYIRTVFNDWSLFGIKDFLYKLYTKPIVTPYWYLYAYFALLIMLPLLRKMARGMSKKEYVYFGALSLLFIGILPSIESVCGMEKGINITIPLVVSDSLFFFVMGYFFENMFNEKYFQKKYLWRVLGINIITIALIWILMWYYHLQNGEYSEMPIKAFVMIPTFSAYYLFRYLFRVYKPGKRMTAVITTLGSCVFGVYLIEEFVRNNTQFIYDKLSKAIFLPLAFAIWIVIVLAIGFAVSFIMKKIPVLKKLI